jgi:hypothetical protein
MPRAALVDVDLHAGVTPADGHWRVFGISVNPVRVAADEATATGAQTTRIPSKLETTAQRTKNEATIKKHVTAPAK